MRFTMSGLVRMALVVAAIAGAVACADDATGPRRATDPHGVYSLPAIDAYSCRYGGEYPNCSPAPPDPYAPGGGTGGMSPGAETPTPTGGTTPPDSTSDECDPNVDPKCELKLTSTDSAAIANAIREFTRPDTAVHDTVQRRLCKEMRDRFMDRFNVNKVFRGDYDSEGGDAHYAATNEGRIHFEPWLLNEAAKGTRWAQRELANAALHEAAHVIGYSHTRGTDFLGHYYDSPFNLLDPGPNVCIQ